MHFENAAEQNKPVERTPINNSTLLANNSEFREFFKPTSVYHAEPDFLDFGKTDIFAESVKETKDKVLIAWDEKSSNDSKLSPLSEQQASADRPNWKVPGKDDGYKGWKPGDAFDPKDFEKFRENVRVYVAEFMKLNHIDKSTAAGEAFRNAFQHELAAAALQKQTNLPVAIIDGIGVGQEFYQAGKDLLGIYGGASMIESGGRIGDGKLVEDGKKAVKENSDKLATMFPTDTPNDVANNHKGAELAQGTNSWDELLNKVANSAAKAPSNDGRGQ
jgi:hypothetical protein